MGVRFRKSVNVAKGVKLNFNKDSVSLTTGVRGAHYTVNSKGTRTTTVGIPGTGLSYQERRSSKSHADIFDVDNFDTEDFELELDSIEDSPLLKPEKTTALYKLPKGVTFKLSWIYINGKRRSPEWIDLSRSLNLLYMSLFFILGLVLLPLLGFIPQTSKLIYSNSIILIGVIVLMIICVLVAIFFMFKWINYRHIGMQYQNYMMTVSKIKFKE